MERCLAVELTRTIRHDGQGGVRDTLASPADVAEWLAAQADLLPPDFPAHQVPLDDTTHAQLVELRGAIRFLFADVVRAHTGPDAEAGQLVADTRRVRSPDAAVRQLNAAAAAAPQVLRLTWPDNDGRPATPRADRLLLTEDQRAALVALLANSAIALLTGPERDRLRACPAPRCVHYFIQAHPRQQWCKPSCGNRTRVARYYQRHLPG
ncbi:CGNR zinc finger domain-containing protein [Goodfellowiella coeruleoviolacea]|uniref:CGNR zinc finger domain-containing protein n=1 Tax=Goodfellowiella coeruleoviolacea TaxID=334858 RepID=A0AAE3GI85_9PSEU|nr:CGNR zinc finger domain-containing protein [Goodfellowiella coeruleoviolacea]MCP2167819.1 CGNR zinc finger domain-containing protein [Goodfellowiella coeruleoviolacea]